MATLIAPLMPAIPIALAIGLATGWWIWRWPAELRIELPADSPFLVAPAGEADDLTRLKGVGPKLSEQLRDLGVFHFSQIAAWTPEQAEAVDSRLGRFSGSIARNRLVEQARLMVSDEGPPS